MLIFWLKALPLMRSQRAVKFCTLLSNCQEFHTRLGMVPTLAEALDWIAPNYINARELPDQMIVFQPHKETNS